MAILRPLRKEDQELITNPDLISAAYALLGEIDLDVASSKVANSYIEALNYYTPQDDGLNNIEWFGKVYLFPPSGTYYFDKRLDKWKMTRSNATAITSSHAVWFQRLYRAWWNNEIEQGLYFTNCPDMIRYEQKIFDFPICILKTAPDLIKNSSEGITKHRTCTSMVVYLQPKDNPGGATQKFIDIYEEKGRIVC
jgi:hypothetical protein